MDKREGFLGKARRRGENHFKVHLMMSKNDYVLDYLLILLRDIRPTFK